MNTFISTFHSQGNLSNTSGSNDADCQFREIDNETSLQLSQAHAKQIQNFLLAHSLTPVTIKQGSAEVRSVAVHGERNLNHGSQVINPVKLGSRCRRSVQMINFNTTDQDVHLIRRTGAQRISQRTTSPMRSRIHAQILFITDAVELNVSLNEFGKVDGVTGFAAVSEQSSWV